MELRLLRFMGALAHGLEVAALEKTSVHNRESWPTEEVIVEDRFERLENNRWKGEAGQAYTWDFLSGSFLKMAG